MVRSRDSMNGYTYTEYFLTQDMYTGTNLGVWQMSIPHMYKISIFGAKLSNFMQLTNLKN